MVKNHRETGYGKHDVLHIASAPDCKGSRLGHFRGRPPCPGQLCHPAPGTRFGPQSLTKLLSLLAFTR